MDFSSNDPVRLFDILLALIFGTLIYIADASVDRALLFMLAVLQLMEGRVPILRTGYGRIASVSLQLLVSFELMHVTGDVASPYIPILLFPVVSTAAQLGVVATVVASVAAICALLAPLLLYDWGPQPGQYYMDNEGWHVLTIRGLLLAATAVLVNMLGTAIRTESARNKATAEKLAAANESLREAEAAMRRAERLAALGQLTAGLAHELRNPLASIKGSADLLARSSSERDPVAKELGEIISSEVDRTNLLVTRFLDFARPLEPRREISDLAQIIDRASGHAGVTIIREFAPDIPLLAIDPALMEQVFINLLSNASQASGPGQPITVTTQLSGENIEIKVIDQGSGIPADKIETIFNPFVTTKQTGVGLGLAIVSKIITGHGGKITVDSEPGKGSTFRITLPLKK